MATGVDTWTFDPTAGDDTFFGPAGYELLVPLWDIEWNNFASGTIASYQTEPFSEDRVITGPGLLELHINSPVEEVTVNYID